MGSDCALHIAGLPGDVDSSELQELFRPYGDVMAARVRTQRNEFGSAAGSVNGFEGFVQFSSQQAVASALAASRSIKCRGVALQIRLVGYVDAWGNCGQNRSTTRIQLAREFVSNSRVTGRVESWRGNYGWIVPDVRIEHPAADRRRGRIYLRADEVEGSVPLAAGTKTSFLVYVDTEGLGASIARVEQPPRWISISDVDANAARAASSVSVHVCGWPASADTEDFQLLFGNFGAIRSAKLCEQQGQIMCGLVTFAAIEAAMNAVESLNGTVCEGRQLSLCIAAGDGSDACTHCKAAPCTAERQRGAEQGGPRPDTRYIGEVCSWCGTWGWIRPDTSLFCQGAADKDSGLVLVSADDVEDDMDLRVVKTVSFLVQVTLAGLEAREVRVERGARGRRRKTDLQQSTGPAKWWHELYDVRCPLSNISMDQLEHEPFGLMSDVGPGDRPEGLHGIAAVTAFFAQESVHWFHGMYLACTLVATGAFVDPVNMRAIRREECLGLDAYLAANALPPVHVVEAFDEQSDEHVPAVCSRLQELKRSATLWLASSRTLSVDAAEFVPSGGGDCGRPLDGSRECAPSGARATVEFPCDTSELAASVADVRPTADRSTTSWSGSNGGLSSCGPTGVADGSWWMTWPIARQGEDVASTSSATALGLPGDAPPSALGQRRRRWDRQGTRTEGPSVADA